MTPATVPEDPTIADLSPAAILALSKLLTKKVVNDARDQVDAGEHEIEVTLHVRGTLNVEDDSQTLQVNKLQPMLLLKLAMDRLNGVTIDALIAESLQILRERDAKPKGKNDDEDEDVDDPALKEFKAKTNAAYKKLARATLQRKRGAVSLTDAEITPAEI